MTLKATIDTKLVRLPEVERGDGHPLPMGTNSLPQPLRLHGTPEDPDVFELQDRISLHTVGESPQKIGKRYADLERALATRAGVERLTDTASGPGGANTNSPEGES